MIRSIEIHSKEETKISSINDFTTDKVNIELALARNTYSDEIVDALYAFTVCEQSITVNPLVISDNMPRIMSVTEMINYHSKHLVDVLERELLLEKENLLDRKHARTLERIFVEERLYKEIEQKRSQQEIEEVVIEGFVPFKNELIREVTAEDVERLLKIPIRRISLLISKNKEEVNRDK